MKYASDFKQIARESLKGKWPLAILTGFVASLIGGNIISAPARLSNSIDTDSLLDFFENAPSDEVAAIMLIFIAILGLVLFFNLIIAIISGPAKLGYAKFNLNLVDKNSPRFGDLFSQFKRFGDGFCMSFLTGLYINLWSLLFVIPGIIKTYSYAMTPYILAENTELTANEAITQSRKMMDGNKGRLFCLCFSFIGWRLLLFLPAFLVLLVGLFFGFFLMTINKMLGVFVLILLSLLWSILLFIGDIIINTYQEVATAAFYREVSYVPVYTPREDDGNPKAFM